MQFPGGVFLVGTLRTHNNSAFFCGGAFQITGPDPLILNKNLDVPPRLIIIIIVIITTVMIIIIVIILVWSANNVGIHSLHVRTAFLIVAADWRESQCIILYTYSYNIYNGEGARASRNVTPSVKGDKTFTG